MRRNTLVLALLLATGVVLAEDGPESERAAPEAQEGPKLLDGMSILGNQDAPKSLVIVPWKTSELGGALGISPLLDDSRLPVDRDVFLRALRYYEIRSGNRVTTTTESDAPQHAAAAPRRES